MYEFVDKWECSNRVEDRLKTLIIPNYLSQFKNDERDVVLKLLENVDYYSNDKLDKIFSDYRIALLQFLSNKNDYILCVPQDDNKINHDSNKILSNINIDSPIYDNLLEHCLNDYKSVVIIDDYCGSGDTIIDFVEKINAINDVKDTANGKIEVSFVPIFITEEARDRLKNVSFSNIDFEVICFKEHKAKYLLEQKLLDDIELKIYYNTCVDREIKEEYIYGYNKVEDLFSTKLFTPNNTLGLIWNDPGRLYKPFFKRKGQNIYDQCKYLTYQQIQLMKHVIRYSKDHSKLNKAKIGLLLHYNYNIEDINRFLGINSAKELIEELEEEKVIEKNGNSYNFKSHLSDYYKINNLQELEEIGQNIDKETIIETNLIAKCFD